jgi:hypothetical protein
MVAVVGNSWEANLKSHAICPSHYFRAAILRQTTTAGGSTLHSWAKERRRWFAQFTDYLASTGMSWTFWAWNPNSGETGGVLQDDWQTINQSKMNALTELIQRR